MQRLQVGVAIAPMYGQVASADRHVVRSVDDEVLVAVLDGIGHGEEAVRAAMLAVQTLHESPLETLDSLVLRCHHKLRATRGVVMSLARLDLANSRLTWLGIGNVTGVLFRARAGESLQVRESLLLRGGALGHRLPSLQSSSLQLAAGDTLVLATDGVASTFDQEALPPTSAPQLAGQILARYGKGNDDALVLVVRYQGQAP
jgi:serine phosphatase RsbU (regulator of sigma subunit)